MTETLGKRIARLRKAAGLTQQELQKRCEWGDGHTNGRVGNYESDKNEPSLADLRKMAHHIGVTPSILAFGVNSNLEPDELLLLSKYRNTNDQGRAAIKAIADSQAVFANDSNSSSTTRKEQKSEAGRTAKNERSTTEKTL